MSEVRNLGDTQERLGLIIGEMHQMANGYSACG